MPSIQSKALKPKKLRGGRLLGYHLAAWLPPLAAKGWIALYFCKYSLHTSGCCELETLFRVPRHMYVCR